MVIKVACGSLEISGPGRLCCLFLENCGHLSETIASSIGNGLWIVKVVAAYHFIVTDEKLTQSRKINSDVVKNKGCHFLKGSLGVSVYSNSSCSLPSLRGRF